MVITVYISGISGNKEVKKRQQRVTMIFESRGIEYECIDIAEPGRNAERIRMKECATSQPALPPQIFNEDQYCGDYDQFDLANETDEIETFLKLPKRDVTNQTNGELKERSTSPVTTTSEGNKDDDKDEESSVKSTEKESEMISEKNTDDVGTEELDDEDEEEEDE